ncbi:unnamed protein product [Arabidopsis thaliana]|uniref:RING-type E3 ubiquitin transferase n=1 Tax=Arabidopsis thaliana TaxID=3702 RepID=A0A5S9X256_ARATH|nr:unnamed protein product [Arabidopsis thaliana]VYS53838.1 unnamed protein product [Arabidopsis thaliana]
MASSCCGDYVAAAASPEMSTVMGSESIALRLLCVVFIILFYGSIILLCFVMYPKLPKEEIGDEEAGEPLPPAVRLTKCGGGDGGDGDGVKADVCVICLEDFKVNDVVRVLVRCKHVFHVDCIDSWCFYKLTCPICRAPFQWFGGDW